MPDERASHEGDLAPSGRRGISKRGWALARASWDAIFGRKRALAGRDRLFQLSPDLLCVLGFDGFFRELNPAWETTLGFTLEELLAKKSMEFVHPEDRESTLAAARKLLAGTEKEGSNEVRYVCKDGSYRWLRWNYAASPEEQLIYCVARDVTERKRAEEALRESEGRYRELVDSLNDIVYEVDTAGRITYVSRAAEGIGGYSRSEVIGRLFTDFLHPDDLQIFQDNFQEAISSGISSPNDYRILTKTGETLWFRTSGRLIFEEDHFVGFRGILTDITERRQAEEALQRARDELEGKVERQLLRRNPYGLTFRELTVLYLVAAGRSDKEVGLELGISPLTPRSMSPTSLARWRPLPARRRPRGRSGKDCWSSVSQPRRVPTGQGTLFVLQKRYEFTGIPA